MLVAISADYKSQESIISNSFGRCNYFLLFDKTKNELLYVENPYKSVMDGAGIQVAKFLISKNVEIVITGKIGENAKRFLNFAGIELVIENNEIINTVINKLKN